MLVYSKFLTMSGFGNCEVGWLFTPLKTVLLIGLSLHITSQITSQSERKPS